MLELTHEQTGELIKMMALGEWMQTAYRDDLTERPNEELFDLVNRAAYESGADRFVFFDKTLGKAMEHRNLDVGTHPVIDAYNEETLADQLTHRLAFRLLEKKYGEKKLKKRDWDETFLEMESLSEEFREMIADDFPEILDLLLEYADEHWGIPEEGS